MKRKFFDLTNDSVAITRGAALLYESLFLDDFYQFRLTEGKKVGRLPDGYKLLIDTNLLKRVDFDVVVNYLGWMIISKRLAKPLTEALYPSDAELVPVCLYNQSGDIVIRDDFYVINALKTFDASVVSSKSVSRKVAWRSKNEPGLILFPILIEKNIPKNVHMFRIKDRTCSNVLIIDNVVRKALCSVHHDGLSFEPVELE